MIKKRTIGILSLLSILGLGSVGFSSFYIGVEAKNISIDISSDDLNHTGYINNLRISSLTICKDGFINEADNSISNTATFTTTFQINLKNIKESTSFMEDSSLNLNINLIENNNKNIKFVNNENVVVNSNLYAFDSLNSAVNNSHTFTIKDENNYSINLNLNEINATATFVNISLVYTFNFSTLISTSFEENIFNVLKDTNTSENEQITSISFSTNVEVIS